MWRLRPSHLDRIQGTREVNYLIGDTEGEYTTAGYFTSDRGQWVGTRQSQSTKLSNFA